jgi:hypothetical protein
MFSMRWPVFVSTVQSHTGSPSSVVLRYGPCHGQILTQFLGSTANGYVVVVQDNAHLVHQPYLLLIVALQGIITRSRVVRSSDEGRVYFGEEAQDIFCRDVSTVLIVATWE